MRLSELTAGIVEASTAADPEITGITADSRKAGPGHVFAALAGAKADGARFAAQAVERGAVAVLAGEGA
ncbi:MAG: Mur ligase domain-containing protein, partial [Siculibacillus sp.]